MISRLSNRIVQSLYKSGAIPAEEKELYNYGFFLLLSKMFFLGIAMAFGAIWNVFWESLLFYIMFSILREYAGGVHASKEAICLISTTTSMFFVLGAFIFLMSGIVGILQLLCFV